MLNHVQQDQSHKHDKQKKTIIIVHLPIPDPVIRYPFFSCLHYEGHSFFFINNGELAGTANLPVRNLRF